MHDWDDLRFLLAIARDGSFSSAAHSLGVTQPTVGRRLAAFEHELGAQLFRPTPSGQELTALGRRVRALAERMEQSMLSIERVASGRDVGMHGRVTITASEWFLESVLCPVLPALSAEYPELQTVLVAETRHVNLLRGEADLAIRPSAFEHQDIVQRELGYLEFGLYASDAYLAQRGAPNFERQCEGHTLIAMTEELTKIPDVAWLPRVAAKARVSVRANGRLPMRALAAQGLGVACLPRFLGDASPSLRILAAPEAPQRKLWLGVHRDARKVPRIRAVRGFLLDAITRLRPLLSPSLHGGA